MIKFECFELHWSILFCPLSTGIYYYTPYEVGGCSCRGVMLKPLINMRETITIFAEAKGEGFLQGHRLLYNLRSLTRWSKSTPF